MSVLTVTPLSDQTAVITFDMCEGQVRPKGYTGSAYQRLGTSTIGGQRTGQRGTVSTVTAYDYANDIASLQDLQTSSHLLNMGFANLSSDDGLISADVYISDVQSQITGGKRSWNGTSYSYALAITFTVERV